MPAPINLPPRATTEALNTLDGNWLDTALGWATTIPTWAWMGLFLAFTCTISIAIAMFMPDRRYQLTKQADDEAVGK